MREAIYGARVISLRKSVSELDRLGELQKTAAECYENAVKSAGEFAVEADARDAAGFRERLEEVSRQWRAAESAGAMQAAHSALRGEMQRYQESAQERLKRLRSDLEGTAKAMEAFAASINANDEDHDNHLKRELTRLDRLSASDSLDEMRRGIKTSTAEIAASLEQMRRSNQMVIAQLKDEIRLLHREREAERKALLADTSGVSSRKIVDDRMGALLSLDQPFCVLIVNLRNIQMIEARHPGPVVDGVLKVLLRRLRGVVGPEAAIGRWSRQSFVAIIDPQPGCTSVTREVTRQLSGKYRVEENPAAEVLLEVSVGVVQRAVHEDVGGFSDKLARLSAALEKA